jgi:ribonuclease PH
MLAGSLALLQEAVQMGDFVVACIAGLDEGRFVPFFKSEVSGRVPVLPSKEEIIETEVLGRVEPHMITQAVKTAIAGCKELRQSIRKFPGEQFRKK